MSEQPPSVTMGESCSVCDSIDPCAHDVPCLVENGCLLPAGHLGDHPPASAPLPESMLRPGSFSDPEDTE